MLVKKERGQTITEYVLVIGIVVVLIIGLFRMFGSQLMSALGISGGKIMAAAAK